MADVVSVGAAVIDRLYDVSHLPGPDGNAFAHAESESFGGVAANVATAIARLGHDVDMISRLGDDSDAGRVIEALRERGIGTERVRRAGGRGERSTYSMVFRAPDGERIVVTSGRSAKRLRLSEDDINACRGADAVFVNAYLPDPAAESLLAALDGGSAFPPIVYDLSGPVPELRDRGTEPATVERLLPHVDVFVANANAAASYVGDAVDPVEGFRDRGCRRGAITRGGAGATLFTSDERLRLPAFDVEAVDTTGAGDAFIAGLLHAWVIETRTPRAAGRFAAALAAINCTEPGAQGGLPDLDGVERFLAERP